MCTYDYGLSIGPGPTDNGYPWYICHSSAKGVNYHWDLPYDGSLDLELNADTQQEVRGGGTNAPQEKALIVFNVGADEWGRSSDESVDRLETPWAYTPGRGVPFSSITVAGNSADENGYVVVKAPGGGDVSMSATVQTPAKDAGTSVGASKHKVGWVVMACSPPLDAGRSMIGIGELVTCYVSPSPGPGVTWSVKGGGTLSSTNGASTALTASQSPGSSTVHAKVGTEDVTQDFQIKAPESITVVGVTNLAFGLEDPNGTQVGARATYAIVIGPANVSFGNASIRESAPPCIVNWPNGTTATNTVRAATNAYNLPCGGAIGDSLSILTSRSLLFNGANYVPFSFTYNWAYQYRNEAGVWVDFKLMNSSYSFSGSDQECQMTYLGTPSSPQGPYK
jgi:hypothetical protein